MKKYAKHDSAFGSPAVTVDGFPLMIDMALVRKAVKYDAIVGKVERDATDEVFWNGVVGKFKELWKASDVNACFSTFR